MLLRKPSPNSIERFLQSQAKLDFTYSAVGATATTPPAGYVVDHTRIKLGVGEAVFEAACEGMRNWREFQFSWLEAYPPTTAIKAGGVVAIVAHIAGLWWLSACRIVYVIEDVGLICKFGFAYGTLPGHPESGEERFLIEWNRADDSVHYDILAFSRPHYLVARLAYPFVRRMQKRFARESAAAMVACCR